MTPLNIRNVNFSIGSKEILNNIGIKLYPGELCALLGPSGAGKSTLIKVLLGIRKPDRGSISIGSKKMEEIGPIGYVPQDDALHRQLSPQETLQYAAQLRRPSLNKKERLALIDEMLRAVDLIDQRKLPIKRLSGGQRKRVSVALELLTNPHLIILDEPTSGLDPGLESRMMELFATVAGKGHIVIVSTHAMESVNKCAAVVILVHGRIAFAGPPAQALQYFNESSFVSIFHKLAKHSAQEWQSTYHNHPIRKSFNTRPPPQTKQTLPSKTIAPTPASTQNEPQDFDGQKALEALKKRVAEKEQKPPKE